MTIRTRVQLDVVTPKKTEQYNYKVEAVHIYNFSPYNVYVSVSANASPNEYEYLVAPQTSQGITTPSNTYSFYLDIIGVPSLFSPVLIDLFDEQRTFQAQDLPIPVGQLTSNLISKIGDKTGDVTLSAGTASLMSGQLNIASTVPTGKCLFLFNASFVNTVSGTTLRVDVKVDTNRLQSMFIDLPTGDDRVISMAVPCGGLDVNISHSFTIETVSGGANNVIKNGSIMFPTSGLVIL